MSLRVKNTSLRREKPIGNMPQEFQVLQCYSCNTFQVHQVKKVLKWMCKLCGEKQSVIKVYGRGSGADCRQHVQKLNILRGELEVRMCISDVSESVTEEAEGDNKLLLNEASPSSLQEHTTTGKWDTFVQESSQVEDADIELEPDDVYTTDAQIFFGQSRKRKKFAQDSSRFSVAKTVLRGTETDDTAYIIVNSNNCDNIHGPYFPHSISDCEPKSVKIDAQTNFSKQGFVHLPAVCQGSKAASDMQMKRSKWDTFDNSIPFQESYNKEDNLDNIQDALHDIRAFNPECRENITILNATHVRSCAAGTCSDVGSNYGYNSMKKDSALNAKHTYMDTAVSKYHSNKSLLSSHIHEKAAENIQDDTAFMSMQGNVENKCTDESSSKCSKFSFLSGDTTYVSTSKRSKFTVFNAGSNEDKLNKSMALKPRNETIDSCSSLKCNVDKLDGLKSLFKVGELEDTDFDL